MEKQSLTLYEVTNDISIKLVEVSQQENFAKCTYCGKGSFWNEIWPSALVISKYLAEEFPRDSLDGCRVLVIGCGVGLEGLVLAKLGANVSFLDHIPEALQHVSQNCLLNNIESFQTICFCWKDSENLQKIGKYDLVICSDVLNYYNHLGEWIWLDSILKATLRTNGVAFFSDPMRFDANDFFSVLANSGFQIKSPNSRWFENQEIQIYSFERK